LLSLWCHVRTSRLSSWKRFPETVFTILTIAGG
jgi:hypothetical protein